MCFNDTNYIQKFNLNNVINCYNIDDLNELDDLLTDSYVNNARLDSKIELITNIIWLVLTNKWIEPSRAFDSDELADDEELMISSTIFVVNEVS